MTDIKAWMKWYSTREVPGSHMRIEGNRVTLCCPNCGHESDEMCNWHRGEPYDQWAQTTASAWRCWECNELHPTIAFYRNKVEALESALAGPNGAQVALDGALKENEALRNEIAKLRFMDSQRVRRTPLEREDIVMCEVCKERVAYWRKGEAPEGEEHKEGRCARCSISS